MDKITTATAEILKECTQLAIDLHDKYSLGNNTRGYDKLTPYSTHPLLGTFAILEDSKGVHLKERLILACAFAFHDILEDTSCTKNQLRNKLIPLISDFLLGTDIDRIIELVEGCTFDGNSTEEYQYFKDLVLMGEDDTKFFSDLMYLKAVDKFINLSNEDYFIKKGTLSYYKEKTYWYATQAIKTRPDSFWLKIILSYAKQEPIKPRNIV